MSNAHHFTYREWEAWTVNKIVERGLLHTPPEHQDGWFRVQIKAAISQALAHGRSGRGDDDPVIGPFDYPRP